MDLETRT